MPGAKIISIVRDPVQRAWSSYKYNYVRPALIKLKKGWKNYPKGESEEYYMKHHVISFELMIITELKVLKECLRLRGSAEDAAMKQVWAKDEILERNKTGLPPLLDLEASCYGTSMSKTVPRKQWKDLIETNPELLISDLQNYHLLQGLIGRGLYSLVLEWYYIAFPRTSIEIVCSEDLREKPSEVMNNVSRFLGLPDFNFTDVVSKGMFNVQGHKGYETATSWEEVEEVSMKSPVNVTPLLLEELLEFLKPYNERLFNLVGRRCNWDNPVV